MNRKVATNIIGGLLLLSVIATLVLFIVAPTTFWFRLLLAIAVLIALGVAALVLVSFRSFFQERRTASARLISEVRTLRSEMRLLSTTVGNLPNLASDSREAITQVSTELQKSIAQDIQSSGEPLQKRLEKLTHSVEDLKADGDSAVTEQTNLFYDRSRKNNEALAGTHELMLKNFAEQEERRAEQSRKFQNALSSFATDPAAKSQQNSEPVVETLVTHISVRAKQLISILEMQRQRIEATSYSIEQMQKLLCEKAD